MKGVGIGGVQIINCNISQNVVSEIKMVRVKLGSHKEGWYFHLGKVGNNSSRR